MHFDLSNADPLDFKIRTLEYRLSQLQLKSNDAVMAKTHSGRIQGAKRRSVHNRTYYSFERIPYALPPVGELRFRAPKPMTPWRKVRDCTNCAPKPVQHCFVDGGRVEGAEDCLYLNVYTNSVRPSKPRPVMVWIYGGGFASGEATREWYAPDHFMRQDIVLATVQYRVGALGFLSLGQPHLHVPGNAGLKDQILALKWIRRNCERFGGDPECITIFGQGSGATSALLLMLSDQAKGLFQRVIAQSSGITDDWTTLHCAERVCDLAKAAGYVGACNEREILEYLQHCTAAQIVEAEARCLSPSDRLLNRFSLFGPCIERFYTQHTVLHKAPMDMLPQAWGNAIPLILGGNSNEGIFLRPLTKQHPEIARELLHTCMSFVPRQAAIDRDSPECRAKGLKLRKLHVKSYVATIEDFCGLASYAFCWHPIQRLIDARLQFARKASTYLYRFDFDSVKLIHPFRVARSGCGRVRADINDLGGDGGGGAAHGDELAYLFHNALADRMESQGAEHRTIKRLIGLWTAFAATGSPNGAKINGLKGAKWHSLRQDNDAWQCLNIGRELEFIELPELPKLSGWQALYRMQRELPQCASELVELPMYAKSAL